MSPGKILSNGTLVRVDDKGQVTTGYVTGLCVDMSEDCGHVVTFGLVDDKGRAFPNCGAKFWCASDVKEILESGGYPEAYKQNEPTGICELTQLTSKWVLGTTSTSELLEAIVSELRRREEQDARDVLKSIEQITPKF